MKIYIMRHGKTVWNEKGITQGRSQNRLSATGVKTTEIVAKQNKNTKFDVIICSPLMRAVQTANIINKYHNVKVIKNENLTEIGQGIFTGRHSNSCTEKEKLLKSERSRLAGMESYKQCYNRVKQFVNELENMNYNSVLVVTHKCPAIYLEMALNGRPYVEIDFKQDRYVNSFDNSQIKMIEIKKQNFQKTKNIIYNT